MTVASVIISNFNYGRFVRDAIASALAQTHEPTEVIVVDDGSTDDSRTIIGSFGERIKTVFKSNGGQASALNAGFEVSRGDVIIFLDADDTLLSTAVERATIACRDDNVAKVHWPLWIVNEQGVRTGKCLPHAPLPEGDLRAQVAREGPLTTATPPTSGNAWTRWFLKKVLPIPDVYRLCADEYLYALATAFGLVKRIQEAQGTYRLHGQNRYREQAFEEKIAFGRRIQDLQCDLVATQLRSMGFHVEPDRWKQEQWFSRLHGALQVIRTFVPAESTIILIDDDQWGVQRSVAGRRCLPFLQRNGTYWGPPANDRAAIEELEQMRREGAEILVLAWPAFWWRAHYRAWHEQLTSTYPCLARSEELYLFDLRTPMTGMQCESA